MNKDKREPEYPAELESQFILRLPEEPAKLLREVLRSGENLKNRLTIQIENDMRRGEVRLDHWLLHAKIVDLPAIIESLKTIDNKSFYKTADICQMMVCKNEPEPIEPEESPLKNKKKDPYKVDKKYLYPHGITPPTKNVRKRRFRKTLRKKCAEAPEIEKEVKRLLRADNEAVTVTYEVITEDDEYHRPEPATSSNAPLEKKTKARELFGNKAKWGQSSDAASNEPSNVVDIFGGAVSDSEEEDNINVEMEDSGMSAYDTRLSDTNSMQGMADLQNKGENVPLQFDSKMFQSSQTASPCPSQNLAGTPSIPKSGAVSTEDHCEDMSKESMIMQIDQLRAELEELKQHKQRTQHEITGMENLTLRQRFQAILHTLNQEIMYKEMKYQGLLVLQNSDDI